MRTRETRARNKHAVSCTHLVELISVFVILFSKSLASASASSSTLSVGSQKVGANEYIDSITTSGGEGGTAAKVDGNGDDDDDYGYYDHVPWLGAFSSNNLQGIDEAARYEELPPNVFSPTGRLHPVEAAVRASKVATPRSNLLLAVKCRDGLLVISTLPISPHVDARIASIANMDNANISSSSSSSSTGIESSNSNTGNNDHGMESNKTATNENTDSTGSNNIQTEEESRKTYPSLFLFDETCTSTTTGPIFEIHPCMVGATAGNSVDNRILGGKLLALGLAATTCSEEDDDLGEAAADRVAKDLANQLQVVTQDIAAAQKQKLGRMLASSAVVLGNRKLWRVDPTGQFWDCQATVLGQDADRVEEAFCRRLFEECERKKVDNNDLCKLLGSMSHDEAFELAKEFLRDRTSKQQKSPTTTKSSQRTSTDGPTKKKDGNGMPASELSSQTYWQAVILDYSSLTRRGTPNRILRRGTFGIKTKD
uniref:Uncharacterized protein n=1 Tax=Pseudo-nitzschia australis TaxID=44445 RepID=A0A7S4AIT4_9STRA|mmetsp:Transcript_27515/g.57670  ORF Transcript_27515/g.57670 Transcript_27515/m.57670 type:complete len:483 (-) Transcript_27515:12-1460(-)